jgi:hypothetical protein
MEMREYDSSNISVAETVALQFGAKCIMVARSRVDENRVYSFACN